MFDLNSMVTETDYHRTELMREAKNRRLVREVTQPDSHVAKMQEVRRQPLFSVRYAHPKEANCQTA